MDICLCGCNRKLHGRASKWYSESCKHRFHTEVRRKATEKLAGKRKWHHRTKLNPHLGKILSLLRETNPTNHDVIKHTGTTRPASDMSELRANGYNVSSVRIGLVNGKRVSRWVLAK